MAVRFLLSRRRQKFFSVAALVAILGLAFGVAALEIALGVTSGLQKEYKKAILSFNSHLILMRGDEISHPQEIGEKLSHEPFPGGLRGWTPFIYREGLLVSGSRVKGIVLKGVDFDKYSNLSQMRISVPGATVEEMSSEHIPSLILGRTLAEELGITGSESREKRLIHILFPQGMEPEKSGVKNVKRFIVSGTFESGLHEYDASFAFLSLGEASDFFQTDGRVSGLEIWLDDPDRAGDWAEVLQEIFEAPYIVMTWKELNENVFRALEMERSIFFILIGILIAVASLNILGTLTMLLLEKRKEVAILRALGMRWARLRKIFLFDGLLIGSAGIALGLLLGFGVLFFLDKWQPIHLAPEVYFVRNVPVDFASRNLVIVIASAFMIIFVGCELSLKRLTRFQAVRSLLEN